MEILKIMGPDPHKNYADPKHWLKSMSVEQQYYPKLQEQLDEIYLLMLDTLAERHIAEPVLGVGICAPLQQEAAQLHRLLTAVHGKAVVQRRVP